MTNTGNTNKPITVEGCEGNYDLFDSGKVQVYLTDGRAYEIDVLAAVDWYSGKRDGMSIEDVVARLG